jgi:hypothetical protein
VPQSQRQPTEPALTPLRTAELLQRIERLESIVLSKSSPNSNDLTGSAQAPNEEDYIGSNDRQKQDEDLKLLESVSVNESSLVRDPLTIY